MRQIVAATALALMATGAAAEFRSVSEQAEFLQLMGGRELTNRLYNLNILVETGGTIRGQAMGWDITGSWVWQDGFFCREMAWGGDVIPYNCQLVEVDGDRMRFTVDRGAGDSASFRLR